MRFILNQKNLPLKNLKTFVEVHSPHGCRKMIINYKSVFTLLQSFSVDIGEAQFGRLIYKAISKGEELSYLSSKYVVTFSLTKKSSIPKVIIKQVNSGTKTANINTQSDFFVSKEPAQTKRKKSKTYVYPD
jgi:hypothetical protein